MFKLAVAERHSYRTLGDFLQEADAGSISITSSDHMRGSISGHLTSMPVIMVCLLLLICSYCDVHFFGYLTKIREHRHKVAHELPEFLVDDAVNINTAYIYKMHELLTKIDVWWFMQTELPTNPDSSAHTDQIVSVKSGPMLILERLLSLLPSNQQPLEEKQ